MLSLFGEADFQSVLKKTFGQNDIFFIDINCNTSVQLTSQLEQHRKETDAVIIYAQAMNMDIIQEYVEELRSFVEHLRIVLILNGTMNLFLKSQLDEYRALKIDLMFDNSGFDGNELIKILQKGKLSNKDFKTEKRHKGFTDDIDSGVEETNSSLNDVKKVFKQPEKKRKALIQEEIQQMESFTEPQGHFTVGVFNAARGAGATWTANNLARYFAMHNYKTCICDMSLTGAVSMMKLKNVDIYTEGFDVEELKSKYNVTIIDFGTPIEVSPKGENFKLMREYKPETIQCFNSCNIKLIMGFSDPWNIEKIKFFFVNDTWRSQFDNSYLFIISGNPEKVKNFFAEGNFFSREDDYREHILDAFRKEETR